MDLSTPQDRLARVPTLGAGSHDENSDAMCVMDTRLARAIAKLHANTRRTEECWLFEGYRQLNGYGWVNVAGLKIAAHRLALLVAGISIERGQDACHTCDTRSCVNPAHLYVGTRRQNMADCTARGRHNKPRGERHWRAKLSTADVREIRLRRRAGDSTVSLASRFGINHATVSRIARGVWRQEVA